MITFGFQNDQSALLLCLVLQCSYRSILIQNERSVFLDIQNNIFKKISLTSEMTSLKNNFTFINIHEVKRSEHSYVRILVAFYIILMV